VTTVGKGLALGFALLLAGLTCLAQAQLPTLGAGKGSRPVGGGGGGTVLFDTVRAPFDAASTTSFSLTNFINIGSGSNGTTNRALVVIIFFANNVPGTVSGITVTFDSAPMTNLGHVGINSDIYLFGLVAPNTGSHTLAANWTGSAGSDAAGVSFVGVDPVGTFLNFTPNTGNSATATVTVTSVSGQAVVAAHEVGTSFSTGNGTDIGKDNGGVISAKAANWTTAAGASTNLTYSLTSATWGSAGVALKAF